MKNSDVIKICDSLLQQSLVKFSHEDTQSLHEIKKILSKKRTAFFKDAFENKEKTNNKADNFFTRHFLAMAPVYRTFATATMKKKINELETILSQLGQMPLQDFIDKLQKEFAPTSDDVVSRYVVELRNSFRNKKEFERVFADLKSDRNVKTEEAKQIAVLFANYERANSKKKALEEIYNIHRYYADSEDISRRLSGQSAA